MKRGAIPSAAAWLLAKTDEAVWHRGENYADRGKVRIIRSEPRTVEAAVRGTKDYSVILTFTGGGLRKRCTCPYAEGASARHAACKHMVAVAILWDEQRGLPRPSRAAVEASTIPPPRVTRTQINALYKDPLHPDLERLRIASESGSWSRPHSRLPHRPDIPTDASLPLTLAGVRQAFREMRRWADRRTFDPYFCAGEMVAAFCEVMRVVKSRLPVTSSSVIAEILREAQTFHYTLFLELIDGSDGLHVFTEAHLDDVYQALRQRPLPDDDRAVVQKKLEEFDAHRHDY